MNDSGNIRSNGRPISSDEEIGLGEAEAGQTGKDGEKHQRKLTQPEKKIETFFNQSHSEPNKSNDDSIYLEIKLSTFLVEHNISFTILDHLTPLLKECIEDSTIVKKMQLKADKGAAIAKNILGRAKKDDLQDELKSSLFSILIDESTDISGVKTMCIIVRFFSPQEERIISKFWELCQVFGGDIKGDQASAEHLFKLVSNSFESHGIPSKHIIGFASDGCNTMMGNKNSVASRFEEQCPGIYIFKCICHSLHLCASEACKQLPRSCEDLARNIYNEFKNSAKRQFLFREFQSFLDTEIHKILRPAQTRWLSLSSVVNRIVEQ
ncbi:uncharacterized protein [Chelonus insularis]|uniref:uncharacterized protein n=1 Tax=Chelonus insularis TaxID=460826 RepID=UPI00158D0122|nr:uncharacterized protein LOC118070182 [Chelonus insularis]